MKRPSHVQRLIMSATRAHFHVPWYNHYGLGKIPSLLDVAPVDFFTGNPDHGRHILHDRFFLNGRWHTLPDNPWLVENLALHAETDLHRFGWLKDLHALGGDQARAYARTLVESWITLFPRWDPYIWRGDVTADRLVTWLCHYTFFGSSADDAFRQRFFKSIVQHVQHLRRTLRLRLFGATDLHLLKGLLFAAVAFRRWTPHKNRWLKRLEKTLTEQLLPDGTHIERSPSVHLAILTHLLEIRTLFHTTGDETPAFLANAIERVATPLKFFRHGDGGLALFNGTFEEDGELIDKLLILAQARTRTPHELPQGGFVRGQCGRALVIMDTGLPIAASTRAHAGTNSFEMSYGKSRVITNCGTYTGDDPTWNRGIKSALAHSTLCIDGTGSADVNEDSRISRSPRKITFDRHEHDGHVLIEATHDGFQQPFRQSHTRRLYLDQSGQDLRGEDILSGVEGRIYTLRFHLHPQVKAGLSRDGGSVLLKIPHGGGWIFKTNGAKILIEDSVYAGTAGALQKTQQIVVSGAIAQKQTTSIKWAFQKEGKRPTSTDTPRTSHAGTSSEA